MKIDGKITHRKIDSFVEELHNDGVYCELVDIGPSTSSPQFGVLFGNARVRDVTKLVEKGAIMLAETRRRALDVTEWWILVVSLPKGAIAIALSQTVRGEANIHAPVICSFDEPLPVSINIVVLVEFSGIGNLLALDYQLVKAKIGDGVVISFEEQGMPPEIPTAKMGVFEEIHGYA